MFLSNAENHIGVLTSYNGRAYTIILYTLYHCMVMALHGLSKPITTYM